MSSSCCDVGVLLVDLQTYYFQVRTLFISIYLTATILGWEFIKEKKKKVGKQESTHSFKKEKELL